MSNENIKLNIQKGYGISQAIDKKLDEDFKTQFGINNVNLGSAWASVFNIIKDDTKNVGKQYSGDDTDYKNNKNFIISSKLKYYEISKSAWDKIVEIAKQVMKVENKNNAEPEVTEVVQQESVNEDNSQITANNNFNDLKLDTQELTEEEVQSVKNKYETIKNYLMNNNLEVNNDKIKVRLNNYIQALKQVDKEKEMLEYMERTIENGTLVSDYKQDTAPKIIDEKIAEAQKNKDMNAYIEAFADLGSGQVQLFDRNGDNKVSLEEYLYTQEIYSGLIGMKNDEKSMLENSFAILDKNNDGSLDILEMATDQMTKRRIIDKENENTSADLKFKEWYIAQKGLSGDDKDFESSYKRISNEMYNGLKNYIK